MIWILLSSVISYGFSSSLLLTYFKSKPVHFVKDIKDVLVNQKINVAGMWSARKLREELGNSTFEKLEERMISYESKMNLINKTTNPNANYINKQILEEILSGKTILLVNSFNRLIMQDTFADFKLELAEIRYVMQFMVYSVSKRHKYSIEITKM